MRKQKERFSLFGAADLTSKYFLNRSAPIKPTPTEVWTFWNNKVDKYLFCDKSEEYVGEVGEEETCKIMLAYEHEFPLLLVQHPHFLQDLLFVEDLEACDRVIFAIFSSIDLLWKQFFAKIIARGMFGALKGKVIYILSSNAWLQVRILDILANQYGFTWRMCMNLEPLGYEHCDLVMYYMFAEMPPLHELLQQRDLQYFSESNVLPSRCIHVIYPVSSQKYQRFLDVVWKTANRQFFSGRTAKWTTCRSDARQEVGRSLWFFQLYSLFMEGKIAIDAASDTLIPFFPGEETPRPCGYFRHLSGAFYTFSGVFLDLNFDKLLLTTSYSHLDVAEDKAAAYLFFEDLRLDDGFHLNPPMKWIAAELYLQSKRQQNHTLSQSMPPSNRRGSGRRKSSFSAILYTMFPSTAINKHIQEVGKHLHEAFQIDLAYILEGRLQFGVFFKPQGCPSERYIDPVFEVGEKKNGINVFLDMALSNGILEGRESMPIQELKERLSFAQTLCNRGSMRRI
jgi:hypothetical protein